jgi:hypothetical protein
VVDVWIGLDLHWTLGFVHCLLMAGGYGLYLVVGSWLDFELDIGWILVWTSSHGYFKDFLLSGFASASMNLDIHLT